MPEGSERLDDIRGVLLDLDGTAFIGDGLVPGEVEAIAALRRGGLPLRFGTTVSPRRIRCVPGSVGELLAHVRRC